MKSVLLSHPHAKPDALGFAGGLSAAGILGAFFTGLVAERRSFRGRQLLCVSRFLPQAANRIVEGIDPSRLRSLAATEVAARSVAKLIARTLGRCVPDGRFNAGYLASVIHDAVVSVLPWPKYIDGVYSYEDIALRTFRRASRKGIARIYDLPLPHYAAMEEMWRSEAARWPGAMGSKPPIEPKCKKLRKDAELAEATHISAASRFTSDSVAALGIGIPVYVTPYGFPVDAFECKSRIPEGPFTVLAVGTHNLRKGTPYLLEAWKRADIKGARLRLVGRMGLTAKFIEPYRALFEHVPYIPRARLAQEYRAADVLAFPTLGDGFGLVMQESMCCGTPVITTCCGGGPECIDHGRDGWIIPERDVDALAEQLRAAASDRDRTFAVGKAARVRAERYTWREAGLKFASVLASI